MKEMTATKQGSFHRNLSIIISGMGLSGFIFWSILFILTVIGNIVYWSGYPYYLGPTSEDVLWGGWIHMFIITFLILMIPFSLILSSSGIITFIGGVIHIRKRRPLGLMISFIINLMILVGMEFILLIAFLFSFPERIPTLLFILGPLILSFFIRLILTGKVIFDHYRTREKAVKSSLNTNIQRGISPA